MGTTPLAPRNHMLQCQSVSELIPLVLSTPTSGAVLTRPFSAAPASGGRGSDNVDGPKHTVFSDRA